MSTYTQLTPAQLRQAAALKEKIEALQKQLNALLGGSAKTVKAVKAPAPAASAGASTKKKKRTLSAAARARIVAAQKARWAKIRAEKKK